MKLGLLGSIGVVALGACDGDTKTDGLSHMTIEVKAAGVVTQCYALRVFDSHDVEVLAHGDPSVVQPTRAAAEASGALCVDSSLPDGVLQIDVACNEGEEHTAQLWLVGVYTESGELEDYRPFCSPGGEVCRATFTCEDRAHSEELFMLSVMRDSNQGFYDIAVVGEDLPEGIVDACFAIRVMSPGGLVWARTLCSVTYGGGDGNITYVAPCSAETATNEITFWLQSVAWSSDVAEADRKFTNPCPAPEDGDIEGWSGGCTKTAPCVENADTVVQFSYSLSP